MRFIIWERSVQKKTDFWILLCCILKEPKINMLEFSCWCKTNSQSIHEELHSIPLIFLNKKSEIWNDFTIFEKWKVKNFSPFTLFEKWKWKSNDSKSRSRSESENQMTQNRDREVNFQKNSREFSRIETLAGHWKGGPMIFVGLITWLQHFHYHRDDYFRQWWRLLRTIAMQRMCQILSNRDRFLALFQLKPLLRQCLPGQR